MSSAVHIGIPVGAVEVLRARQLRRIADRAGGDAGGLAVGNIQIGSAVNRRRVRVAEGKNSDQKQTGNQKADASFFHHSTSRFFVRTLSL